MEHFQNVKTLVLAVLITLNGMQVLSQVPSRTFGSKDRESNHLLELARQEIQEKKYQQALQLLNRAVQFRTDNIDAYFLRAMVKENIEDTDGALVDYQIVLLLDSTYREAALHRAILRYNNDQFYRAIGDFNKVLSMGSSGTQQIFFKGTPLNQSDEVGITGITTTHSMDADVHNYIGLCYQALDQHSAAIESFNTALDINPDDANFLVNRGLSNAALSDSHKAINDFKLALEKNPEHALAQFNLTRELETSENMGTSSYDQIIDDNPEFASAYVNRAMVKLNTNDLTGALEDYDKAVAIDPQDPVIYINRALAREKANLLKSALADYNYAITLDPTQAIAFRSRGRVLFKMGKYNFAIEDLNEAIRLDPEFGGAYFNRALIHQKLGQINRTCQDLKIAEEMGIQNAANAITQYCADAQ